MKINQIISSIILISLCSYSFAQVDPVSGCDSCQPLGFNILNNGDFAAGDTGFNSDLISDSTCPINSYTIINSSNANCSGLTIADQTSGTGNYMYINAALEFDGNGNPVTDTVIWSQDLLLLEDQEYVLSFWVNSLSIFNPEAEPILGIEINGTDIGSTTSINESPIADGGWQKYCFNYTSIFEGVQTIEINQIYPNNSLSEGSAFLLDDINLSPLHQDAIPCELIVEYVPGTTQAEKDIIRNTYDITVQDSCVCGDIDLWLINQFPMYINGDTIIDIEKLKLSSKDSADVQDVDYNYLTQNHARFESSNTSFDTYQYNDFSPTSDDSCAVVVAIIDTGVDASHPDLNNQIWSYSAPCPSDATNGYNFAYNNNDPTDDGNNGHGTHVAGIVASQFNTNNLNPDYTLEIMPVKAQDNNGSGTLFKVICSTLFAVDNGADVINMSFGYRGDSTAILYNAIEKGRSDNEVIVVASAGNDAKNNDLYGHYPSNLSNPNLIAVAADTTPDMNAYLFTTYSCYGENTVDISAFGSLNSSVPSFVDPSGYLTLNGTSMAAPQIAAAAAIAKPFYQNSGDAAAIKSKILSSGNPSVNLPNTSTSDLSFDMNIFRGNLPNTIVSCIVSNHNIQALNSLVEISPNPAMDILNISYDGDEFIDKIIIYDIQGKLITGYDFPSNHQLNIEKLEKGFYVLELITESYKMRKKFIKM